MNLEVKTVKNFLLLATLTVFMFTGCAAPVRKPGIRPSAIAEMKADFIREHKKNALKYGIRGEIKKALEQWEIIAALDAEDAEAQKQVENTRKQIDNAVSRALNKARWYERQGKTDIALKQYLAVLKLDPGNSTAYNTLQRINKQGMLRIKPEPIDDKRYAPTTVKEKPVKTKKSSFCDLAKGKKNLREGDLDKAVLIFQKCLEKNPDDPNIRPFLRRAYEKELRRLVQKNRISEAKSKLKEALVYFPEDSGLISIVTVQETSADKKTEIKALVSQAKKLRKEGDLEGALQAWEDVLDIQPGYPGAEAEVASIRNALSIKIYLTRAADFKKKGNYDKALEEWNKVLDLDSRNREAIEAIAEIEARAVDTYYRQGLVHYKNQRLKQAIEQWEKLLAIDPDHKKAKTYINKAKRMLKKLEEIDATSKE